MKTSTILATLLVVLSQFGFCQNALDFDGTNDYVQTSYSGISGTSARTIEAWIKTTANSNPASAGGTGQKTIVDYGTFVNGQRFTFNLLWNNSVRIEVGGNGLSGTFAVNDGNWHHVAVVYDPLAANDYSLYIDGNFHVSGNLTVATNTNLTNNVVIGRRIDGVNYFDGSIDEVRIWDVARTATEIMTDMNTEFCTIPSSLVAYYKANSGTAGGTNTGVTTLLDNSGNGNNGTLNNFSLTGSSSNWVSGASLSTSTLTGAPISVTSCVPYTTLGNQVLNSTGSVSDTVITTSGCDSIYTLNFTALTSSSSSMTATGCNFYVAPSGTVYTTSGVYNDTLVNSVGCDSIVTINLTVNLTTGSTISPTECNSYTSPAGNIYTTSGTYVDTFQNAAGCDSMVIIQLTIFNDTLINLQETSCDSYTSPSGQIFTTSGTYQDTVPSGIGCDSIFTIQLTIVNSTTATITKTSCGSYTSDLGNTYSTSGMYTEKTINSAGCDSTITLNITITNIDNSVTQNGFSLQANTSGLSYQWLDCATNTTIPNATNQTFVATQSGDYAVILSDGNCVDTSDCITVTGVGIQSIGHSENVIVFPNPAEDYFIIESNSETMSQVEVYDMVGKRIITVPGNSKQIRLKTEDFVPGMYFVKITSPSGVYSKSVTVK